MQSLVHTLADPSRSFAGFDRPESNFFRLPNTWTDLTAQMSSLAELKVVEYVLKHTWGYQEFDVVKKITLDEFMHGRKDRTGARIDQGTGLSKQAVLDGLRLGVAHGLLQVEVDDSDRARIKKFYKLRMKVIEQPGAETGADGHGSFTSVGVNQVDANVNKVDTGVQNRDSSGQETRPRSEQETQQERFNNVHNVAYAITGDWNVSAPLGGPGHSVHAAPPSARSKEEVAYFAQVLADKLGDQKSLSYYKLLCARYDPHQLLQKAAEIMGDGGARKPGAVFAAWAKSLGQGSGVAPTGQPPAGQPPGSRDVPTAG